VLAIGLCEAYRVGKGWATPTGNGFNNLKEDYEPGFLGFDPLGIMPEDDEELKVMQTKELNNGRLAMIAIAGFVAQELVNQREGECVLFTCAPGSPDRS
jgi:light-harvesting complex I chlorophyll a/b binding protein 1